jgi:hypothetical protein
MIREIFIFTILISLIIVSEENQNDIVSVLQQQVNITCLCTPDEQCEGNTNTCRLTHEDHACYESWSKEFGDTTIQHTAGYEKYIE